MATRNRYAEIMAQYAQTQPYSFFGYPQSYTGGYDVAQPQTYAAPATRYEEIMAQPAARMGGQGLPTDYNPEWTALSDAEKAAFYAESPFFSGATQLGQKLFGVTSLGALQKSLVPDFVARQKLIAMGIDPATMDYSNEGKNYPAPTGGFVTVTPQQAAEAAAVAQAAAEANREPITETRSGGGGSGGAISGGGGMLSSQSSATRAALRSNEGYGGFAQGGHVSMMHLGGPDPEGPDDGYAALKDGEFVMNDKAVKKYGIELMNAINTGKISKGKLLGLLEM